MSWDRHSSHTIYKGYHYHCDKDNHLRKEFVRFSVQKDDRNKYVFRVGKQLRKFTEEELCFFELDHIEFTTLETTKVKKPFVCMRSKTKEEKYKNFTCLTIVIYKIKYEHSVCLFQGSNRIKLFDPDIPGKQSSLKKLEKKLQTLFGDPMKQWFMYVVEDNNNEQSARVVLRKSNFSVLDKSLNVLHYHQLQNLQFKECTVNPVKRLLKMRIIEQSLCSGSNEERHINLRSSMTGSDITYGFRANLCNQLHEIHYNNYYSVVMTDDPDSMVVQWIRNLNTTSVGDSKGIENTDSFTGSCDSKESLCSDQMSIDIEGSVPSVRPTPCPCSIPPPSPHLRQPCENSEPQTLSQWSLTIANPPCCKLKLPKRHLIRADSVHGLCNQRFDNYDLCNNNDNNAIQSCDDNDYSSKIYQYYKNTGWIRCDKKTRMSERIHRQMYMEANISGVDFNVVNKHEQWWDCQYRSRADDRTYTRTKPARKKCNLAPPSTETEVLYWNGDLCITIQLLMEGKAYGNDELSQDLDLSSNQLYPILIYLSLDSQPCILRKDWRDFAEILGLKCRDIEIVQHFCYTYREWAARVILCHWKLLRSKGRDVPAFNFCSLRRIVIELGREDLLKIIDYSDTNCLENQDNCTHL